MRRSMGFLLLFVGLALSPAAAQAPTDLPRLQLSDLTFAGVSTLPTSCAPKGQPDDKKTFAYSSGGLGLAQGGVALNAHDWYPGVVGVVSTPTPGTRATVVQTCVSLPDSIQAIDPGSAVKVGGTLFYQGRQIVSLYSYYDADGSAWPSHVAVNPSTGAMTAPQQVGGLGAGYVAGYMATVPQEWQALLGGPALTGQGPLPIISRANSGPGVSVFDPAKVGMTTGAVPATPLLYYPLSNPLADVYSTNDLLTFADIIGGVAIPSGTRTLLFVGRHGAGRLCYGEAAACNDLAGGYKGYHAYPYRVWAWLYDLNDLLKVKAGTVKPWDVRPYAAGPIPGVDESGNFDMPYGGAVYDPAARRFYVMPSAGDNPRLYIINVGAGVVQPPPAVDCVLSPWSEWQPTSDWSACTGQQQTRQATRTRAIVTPPSNGGLACGPLTESRAESQACIADPPPTAPATLTCAPNADRTIWTCKSGQ